MEITFEELKRKSRVTVEGCKKLKGFTLTYYEWSHSRETRESYEKDLESKSFPIKAYQGKPSVKEEWNGSHFQVYGFVNDKLYIYFSVQDRIIERGTAISSTIHCYDGGWSASGKSVRLDLVFEDELTVIGAHE